MNLLRKMASAVAFWLSDDRSGQHFVRLGGGVSDAGEMVNEAAALSLSTAWACVNLHAGVQASLPLRFYRGAGPDRQSTESLPLANLLRVSPNADQSAFDFWVFVAAMLELRGNAYVLLHRNARGDLVALEPVEAEVHVSRRENGALRYQWSAAGHSHDHDSDRVFHLRGFYGGPLGGLSTLGHARQVLGLSRAADKAAASTFRNGLKPGGVLKFDKWLSDEQRDIAHGALIEQFTGAANAGKPMVLEGGASFSPLTLTPEDAQMLESRSFSVEEICRFYGVPPFMVGHTEKTTSWGNGVEQQTLGFAKFSVTPRLRRIEKALVHQLLSPAERSAGIGAEFGMEGFLRGDSKSRAAFFQSMTQIGAMTINEVRALENLPPVPGGDVPRMQMQHVPITEAAGGLDPAQEPLP